MLKKIFLLIFCSALFYSCDYSPVHLKNKNSSINIIITNTDGDAEINNYIIRELKQNSNEATNKFDVKMNTTFTKRILAKNTKGFATDYELNVVTSFEVKNDDEIKIFKIKENFKYKNLTNNYEQSNYEKMIKKNFAKSIASKLSLRLTTLQ